MNHVEGSVKDVLLEIFEVAYGGSSIIDAHCVAELSIYESRAPFGCEKNLVSLSSLGGEGALY